MLDNFFSKMFGSSENNSVQFLKPGQIERILYEDKSIEIEDLIAEAKMIGVRKSKRKGRVQIIEDIIHNYRTYGIRGYHTILFENIIEGRSDIVLPTNKIKVTYEILKKLNVREIREEIVNQDFDLEDIAGKNELIEAFLQSINIRKSMNFPLTEPLRKLLTSQICNPRGKILFKVHVDKLVLDILITSDDIEKMDLEDIQDELIKQKIPVQGTEDKKELAGTLLDYIQDHKSEINSFGPKFQKMIKKKIVQLYSKAKSTDFYFADATEKETREKLAPSRTDRRTNKIYQEPAFI